MSTLVKAGAIAYLVLFLSACTENEPEISGDSPVARAGTSYIYPSDFEHHLKSYGEKERAQILSDSSMRQRLLESIAITAIMAQKQEESLSDHELREVDAEIRAYRQQLLARSYASSKVVSSPITMDALRSYYDTHPEYSGEGAAKASFDEVAPRLRQELGLKQFRIQMLEERKKFNKDIEYFD